MKRLRHLATFVGSELGALRRERAAGGIEHALAARVGHHAGTGAVRSRLDDVAGRVEDLARRAGTAEGRLTAVEGERAFRSDLDGYASALAARLHEVASELEAVRAVPGLVDELRAALGDLERRTAESAHRVARLERAESVGTVMAWIAQAHLRTSPLVSVILPTRNRAAQLPRAVASVIDQTYPNWELVVVDDGSDDGTGGVVATFGDPRIRYHRVDHRGVCGARNVALAEARGDLIAYLDDDNTMHPGWLKAVVWGFEQHPEADAAYGAFVIDDWTRVNGPGAGSPPTLFLHPYDRETLLRSNLADISAIAHRARLPEARFDEGLREMGDWDLLVRITAHRDPLVLPAIACFYATDAPNRLSGGPTFERDWHEVLRKNGVGDEVRAQ